MRDVQLAASIEPHAANTVETIEDHASVAAGVASEPIVLEAFIELAFFGIRLEDVLECR